jgi:hypothetical protein
MEGIAKELSSKKSKLKLTLFTDFSAFYSTMKMEAVCLCETFVNLYQCNASRANRLVLLIDSLTVISENCFLSDQTFNMGSEDVGFESEFLRGFTYWFQANAGRIGPRGKTE